MCVMCIYSINTRFDAILKSSYLQKSSLCKRVLGKSFVLFHAERFSTEAERKHVRVKEAERRDETSCLWVANTFEIADIKAWRMRSTLSLFLFFLCPSHDSRTHIGVHTNTHSSTFHLQLAHLLREWYCCHFEVFPFECHLCNQVPPTVADRFGSEAVFFVTAEVEIERFRFSSRFLPVQLISK